MNNYFVNIVNFLFYYILPVLGVYQFVTFIYEGFHSDEASLFGMIFVGVAKSLLLSSHILFLVVFILLVVAYVPQKVLKRNLFGRGEHILMKYIVLPSVVITFALFVAALVARYVG